MPKPHRLITNEELEFLGASYVKLKANPVYQAMSTAFHEYINEFLERELIAIQRMKGVKRERPH